jgi:hypothetical protein
MWPHIGVLILLHMCSDLASARECLMHVMLYVCVRVLLHVSDAIYVSSVPDVCDAICVSAHYYIGVLILLHMCSLGSARASRSLVYD